MFKTKIIILIIISVVNAMPGGWQPIEPLTDQAKDVANWASKEYMKKNNNKQTIAPLEDSQIQNMQYQVVAGLNYHFKIQFKIDNNVRMIISLLFLLYNL
jgi:hypothetical protein